jgi:glycosyltransferase involved in cell wall biosynthesis
MLAGGERPTVRSLLFAGRIHPDKGLHVVVDALARAPSLLRLTVVGPEVDRRYAQLLRRRAPAGRVTWLGRLPRAELMALLPDHDAFLYPSVAAEAGLLGPLEAMAAGLVVISSAPGAPSEALEHERDALLFAPGDVAALAALLERVASDAELVGRLRAGARETAARFSLEHVVDQAEALLAMASRTRGSPSPSAAAKARALGR